MENALNFMNCDRLVEKFGFPYLKSRDVLSSAGERFTPENEKPYSRILPSVSYIGQYEISIFQFGTCEHFHYSRTVDSPEN